MPQCRSVSRWFVPVMPRLHFAAVTPTMASSKKPSDMDHFFAGLIGGTAAAISTNWLEIVKTRQQSAGVTAEVRNMRVDRILR